MKGFYTAAQAAEQESEYRNVSLPEHCLNVYRWHMTWPEGDRDWVKKWLERCWKSGDITADQYRDIVNQAA